MSPFYFGALHAIVTFSDFCDRLTAQMRSTKAQPILDIIRWHKSFDGLLSRVAARLGIDPSYVSRVARGERSSPEVIAALRQELRRLEKLKPR